jgi:hypothetical protein
MRIDEFYTSKSPYYGKCEIVVPPGTREIHNFQFAYIYSLRHVIMPNTVVKIGSHTFDSCRGLNGFTLSTGLKTIGHFAFSSCTSIEKLIIPEGVVEIPTGMCYNCTALKIVVIPGSVTTIDNLAFFKCTNLNSVVIPESVTTIGRGMFKGCNGLNRIWNKSKCELTEVVLPWGYIQGETPPLKELERWTFALHWHWKYPDRITPDQIRLFTLGVHCLSLPVELCQVVFTYIPR